MRVSLHIFVSRLKSSRELVLLLNEKTALNVYRGEYGAALGVFRFNRFRVQFRARIFVKIDLKRFFSQKFL